MKPRWILREARGQAMVELALGSLVLVTVLIFVIHFTEIGYISVKVTEASHSAMLDATGHRLHRWPDDDDPATSAAALAGAEAQARYQDFDSTSRTGSTTLTQVFTEATNLNVACEIGGGPDWDPSPITGLAYSDNGGMRCRAQAEVHGINIPQEFVEDSGQGFFKKKHYEMAPFRVCAFGRASGGSCAGELTTVLDDWGLSGKREGLPCIFAPDAPLVPCTNAPFWLSAASVHALTGAGLGFSGSNLAMSTVGAFPMPFFFGAENVFWMGAAGNETAFLQTIPSEGFKIWPTTPVYPTGVAGAFYSKAYLSRKQCFLGHDCP
ncbi:pilus assembly protein [Hyalangium sp.]|uniref:pilus assembly protein n=1 Tax=Hyalangium sp. TaxID=2028555 RepID=UPI002D714870|nr:pilus assembly protein [Hyalangium sp.]HYH99808.1 pilus assembly protein [Hyalangium sp.]